MLKPSSGIIEKYRGTSRSHPMGKEPFKDIETSKDNGNTKKIT